MSMMATAAKVTGWGLAATAGAGLAKVAPADPSIWTIVVVGIPLSVLAAAQVASAIRNLREPAQPDRKLVWRAVISIGDGFIGGWLAMSLIGLPATREYVGDVVRPEVIGALCALLVQFIRDHAQGYWDQIWGVAVEAFRSWAIRRSGAPRPPNSGGDA